MLVLISVRDNEINPEDVAIRDASSIYGPTEWLVLEMDVDFEFHYLTYLLQSA